MDFKQAKVKKNSVKGQIQGACVVREGTGLSLFRWSIRILMLLRNLKCMK